MVAAVLTTSCISAVNLAETMSKLVEYGKELEAVAYQLERRNLPAIPFDAEQAKIAASLWKTRAIGLSLDDRACLALLIQRSLPAYTADADWVKVDVGVKIVKIR